MKTVGEFKKAGLVFVGNDKLRRETNNHDSDEISMNRCWLEHDRYSGFLEVSDGYFANKEWAISSFAWRENTGVKPEFIGLIEFKFNGEGCEMQEARSANSVNWAIVKKWRPRLNQHQKWPEKSRMDIIGQNGNDGLHYDNAAQQVEALAVNNKPIFTQAMACAGEFPLIGAKCVYVFMENGSEYTGSIAAIDGNVIWFKLDGGGYKTCFGVHKFKAVDNRTDREKAIDEMLELDLWATDREFLEAIYDAGYRKC